MVPKRLERRDNVKVQMVNVVVGEEHSQPIGSLVTSVEIERAGLLLGEHSSGQTVAAHLGEAKDVGGQVVAREDFRTYRVVPVR